MSNENKWQKASTIKKIRFPLIMSVIAFLIGIFLSYDSIGFPLKAQLIILLSAFIPCILFLILSFMIYKNRQKKKIASIFKTVSIVITCLLLFYYFISLFIITLTKAINPMTNPKYYSFHIPDKEVFPKKIPNNAQDVKFLYAPGILQGGTRYNLYYINKKMTLDKFDKKYKKQSKWIGRINDYTENSELLNKLFYYTPSDNKNENDYVIYLIKEACDGSGYCNHGYFLVTAFNEKTHQTIYSTEAW